MDVRIVNVQLGKQVDQSRTPVATFRKIFAKIPTHRGLF